VIEVYNAIQLYENGNSAVDKDDGAVENDDNAVVEDDSDGFEMFL
jgi:hypothetical protein